MLFKKPQPTPENPLTLFIRLQETFPGVQGWGVEMEVFWEKV